MCVPEGKEVGGEGRREERGREKHGGGEEEGAEGKREGGREKCGGERGWGGETGGEDSMCAVA